VDLAVEAQDQPQRVLGDGMQRVGRDAHDADAMAGGGGQVHVVESGAAEGDTTHAVFGEPGERGGVDDVVDEDAHGVSSVGQVGGSDGEEGVEIVEPVATVGVGDVREPPVVRLGAVDADVHRRPVALQVGVPTCSRRVSRRPTYSSSSSSPAAYLRRRMFPADGVVGVGDGFATLRTTTQIATPTSTQTASIETLIASQAQPFP
jgi:hypothetical protein